MKGISQFLDDIWGSVNPFEMCRCGLSETPCMIDRSLRRSNGLSLVARSGQSEH